MKRRFDIFRAQQDGDASLIAFIIIGNVQFCNWQVCEAAWQNVQCSHYYVKRWRGGAGGKCKSLNKRLPIKFHNGVKIMEKLFLRSRVGSQGNWALHLSSAASVDGKVLISLATMLKLYFLNLIGPKRLKPSLSIERLVDKTQKTDPMQRNSSHDVSHFIGIFSFTACGCVGNRNITKRFDGDTWVGISSAEVKQSWRLLHFKDFDGFEDFNKLVKLFSSVLKLP